MKFDEIMMSSSFIKFHQISSNFILFKLFSSNSFFFQTQITPSKIVTTKGQGSPNAFQIAYVSFPSPSILIQIPFHQGQSKKSLSCNCLFMCLVLVFNVFFLFVQTSGTYNMFAYVLSCGFENAICEINGLNMFTN